jgi:hypothetical protein
MTDADRPRLLAVMGSGETAPTMAKTHRALLERVDPGAAVLVDTPFGFQRNADDLARRAVEYFRESVGHPLQVATFRTSGIVDTDPLGYERTLEAVRRAVYVFAGPGSPSYALRQWAGTAMPALLRDKLRPAGEDAGVARGCVTFASAAALTLGVKTVPVYEIYKVGEPPAWLDGLNLLATVGLPGVALIPHYNNAEGGTHDTRFCYLGEERLAAMEAMLPAGAWVLGVDEHTAAVFDLAAGTATVSGLGVMTVRAGGRSQQFESGATVPIRELREAADALARGWAGGVAGAGDGARAGGDEAGGGGDEAGGGGHAGGGAEPHDGHVGGGMAGGGPAGGTEAPRGATASPLLMAVAELDRRFAEALGAGDPDGAAAAVLELESELHAWSRDSLQSDEADRGRAVLRSMIVRLGEAAGGGLADPAEVLGPFVDALLSARSRARDAGRWDEADAVRDRLVSLGVEVSDRGSESTWTLRDIPAGRRG